MLVYISPMSGYTDYSYRQIMKEFKPDLMYTEMVNSNLLIQNNEKTLNNIMRMSEDENTGIQLFGSKMEDLYTNFVKLHEMGYKDLLLNMGCPQPKILKNGSGANMLSRVDEVYDLILSLKDKNIPVSIKIRDSENTMKYFKLANISKMPYLCIHTRTKEMLFNGKADHKLTKRLSEMDRDFKFIANGDIHSYKDYEKISRLNIDGVMLARGIVKSPYLIQEIKEGREIIPSLEDVKSMAVKHLNLLREDKGERKAVIQINKFLLEYFSQFDKETLKSIMKQKEFDKKIEMIQKLKDPR